MTGLKRICYVAYLGRVDYSPALDLQLRICERKKAGSLDDFLLLLEHPPTITLGRNGEWSNLVASREELIEKGVDCFETDRGGDITYHGPGQLVGYPIIQMTGEERDVHLYMRNLEEVLIRLLRVFGVNSFRAEKVTGVWTESGKVAALGVHLSRWITRHGFALNVNTDLSFFNLIVPCGLVGKSVASMQLLLERTLDLQEVAHELVGIFGEVFNRRMVELQPSQIENKLELLLQNAAKN